MDRRNVLLALAIAPLAANTAVAQPPPVTSEDVKYVNAMQKALEALSKSEAYNKVLEARLLGISQTIEALQKTLAGLNPGSIDVDRQILDALERGDADQAISQSEQDAIKATQATAEKWKRTAIIAASYNSPRSEDLLTTAITYFPTDRELWFTLGLARLGGNKDDEAISAFEKAAEFTSDAEEQFQTRVVICGALISTGKAADAVELAQSLLDQYPSLSKGDVTWATLNAHLMLLFMRNTAVIYLGDYEFVRKNLDGILELCEKQRRWPEMRQASDLISAATIATGVQIAVAFGDIALAKNLDDRLAKLASRFRGSDQVDLLTQIVILVSRSGLAQLSFDAKSAIRFSEEALKVGGKNQHPDKDFEFAVAEAKLSLASGLILAARPGDAATPLIEVKKLVDEQLSKDPNHPEAITTALRAHAYAAIALTAMGRREQAVLLETEGRDLTNRLLYDPKRRNAQNFRAGWIFIASISAVKGAEEWSRFLDWCKGPISEKLLYPEEVDYISKYRAKLLEIYPSLSG